MIIKSIMHHTADHKLSFEYDYFRRSRWHIKNESGDIVAVADIPVKLFKSISMDVYDGNMNSVICHIKDHMDSPFSVKDKYDLEFYDGEKGAVIFGSKIGYERYYSNLGIELRVAGNHKTIYKDGEIIAKCKENARTETTTIVYGDKQYLSQIILVFFTHVLKEFKDDHNQ